MNAMEQSTNQLNCWQIKDKIIFQTYDPSPEKNLCGSVRKIAPQSHIYDFVFDEQTMNGEIYERIGKPLINNVMGGYHAWLVITLLL